MKPFFGTISALDGNMIVRSYGVTFSCLHSILVTVEAEIQRGLPKFEIIGLAQHAVQEGRNRILSALRSLDIELGHRRIVVNLAPASVPKDGAALDLPIALGLLGALGIISPSSLERKISLGELSLDGRLSPVRGGFLAADFCSRQLGWPTLILPEESATEAFLGEEISILGPHCLWDLVCFFKGEKDLPKVQPFPKATSSQPVEDFKDVGGQVSAKRALEIAAAGRHNILLVGPPGVGKTILARRFPTILPELEKETFREVQKIWSVLGKDQPIKTLALPPFRSPHHSASLAGMIGGGRFFRPGEFTLAHGGVLFLDEMAEFRRDVLEALREPMEDGIVRVTRAEGVFHLPADFLLIGAMNLCLCGGLGDPQKICSCSPLSLQQYRNKISGPLKDRIDLTVCLSKPQWSELKETKTRESSEVIRSRVIQARERQKKRRNQALWNGAVSSKRIESEMKIHPDCEKPLSQALEKMSLSPRGIEKTIKVACTLADLEGSSTILPSHVLEALQYRP